MASRKASSSNGADKTSTRALPSWMSTRGDGNGDKQADDGLEGDGEGNSRKKKARGQGKEVKDNVEESGSRNKSPSGPSSLHFSKLLDGVVFVLSGFVNPERGILRSQALEMGAEYQADWNSNCTLLVCAFPNTPKFRQVEADGGTIVSKDWITECYTQKKLVDIENYLLHIGKPWRKSNISHVGNRVSETSQPSKSRKQDVKQPETKPNAFTSSREMKGDASKSLKEKFSPSKVKKWAVDDLNKTLTWLESQEEKPEPGEVRNVAAEGILTCLQDAIDLLDKKQDLQQLTEQWNMVPHVVEELIKVQGTASSSSSISKEDLHKHALTCKKIYERELKGVSDGSNEKSKEPKSNSCDEGKGGRGTSGGIISSSMDYDSDETVEMTEDEINNAYNSLASKIPAF